MYSKAKISGHPIHPALVAFPIACYVATLVVLLAFEGTRDVFWWRLGCYASTAGVIMAGVAAIPGLIDLLSIPKHTRARQVGLAHGALNVITLLLFLVTTIVMWRQWERFPMEMLNGTAPIALAVIGTCTLLAAGWLGWALVQTHHVGVTDALPLEMIERRETTMRGTGPMVHPGTR